MVAGVTFYDQYKPFRNYMRNFGLREGLFDIWQYSHHIIDNQEMPRGLANGLNPLNRKQLKRYLYPWDIEILAREIILNGENVGKKRLKNWGHISSAINHLRRLDGEAYDRGGRGEVDVLHEMHRIAHRQFPWQLQNNMGGMFRALKIYGEENVSEVLQQTIGMTADQFLLIGMMLCAHFQNNFELKTDGVLEKFGITREVEESFFQRITSTLPGIKQEIASIQSYDQDWLYVWNPMEAHPLLQLTGSADRSVICPIPKYLMRRVSSGLFFDLINEDGFDNFFGHSFEAYVGEVIERTCDDSEFCSMQAATYRDGKNKKHGVDRILSDQSGHLFIECKTKRLTINAKTKSDFEALSLDLQILANAISQNYKNISDALSQKTIWKPDGLPLYPIILTLEDWYVFGPRTIETLNEYVVAEMRRLGIPDSYLEEMPFTIASVREFECLVQVFSQTDIESVMSLKVDKETADWSVLPFLMTKFSDEMKRVDHYLFEKDWDNMMRRVASDAAKT